MLFRSNRGNNSQGETHIRPGISHIIPPTTNEATLLKQRLNWQRRRDRVKQRKESNHRGVLSGERRTSTLVVS